MSTTSPGPRVLLRSEESEGAVSIVETSPPPGTGPPLHRHDFDEAFYVIEGRLSFQVGDELVEVGPGELAFVPRGAAGIVLVVVVQFGLVASCGVYNPVLATLRLQQTPAARVARVLSAWSVSTKASIAVMTGLWGLLGAVAGKKQSSGQSAGQALDALNAQLSEEEALKQAELLPAPTFDADRRLRDLDRLA